MVRENSKKENNDRKKEDEKEKIPDGPEKNAKADSVLKEGAVEEREGKKVAFMLKEKPVEPKKKQAVLFVIYFAIVVGLASIVIEGSMTKNKSIKEHLGRHGLVKVEDEDKFVGSEEAVLAKMRASGRFEGKSNEEVKKAAEDYFLNPEVQGGAGYDSPSRKRGRASEEIRAREALPGWQISLEANRQLIVVSGTRYNHRGVMQFALGESARAERRGFEFDRENMRWIITMRNFLLCFEGRTAEEVDEDVIRAVLQASIEKGNEDTPDNGSVGRG